ncbi:hypothetical protein REC12_10485 [Desulfosporosinus sp. PR]|uniref:hypothetical protein n=1 Tax=Candidatus Desulfosporosinus nitrosoreducens TaxID=3401928 RepID=UPI0027F28B2C|nr:hypothetical protein [Desulfosporosinus sp. PR]MDQ7094016.1 hypothetical protein [Desulfosporosinus sp. PR]
MIFGTFIVYVLIFGVIISYPGLTAKDRSSSIPKLLAAPILIGAVLTLLTALKIYFFYKFILLLFIAATFLLSYWQWGSKIRRWWR